MDQITRRAVAAQLAVAGVVTGMFDRVRRNDAGQGSVEYVGIIIVVGLIIAAVITFATPIGSAIGQQIQDAVDNIGG